jgi:hypothetical protein
VYDDRGRIAKTVAASPWTPEDRALMVARGMVHNSRCPGCGHPKATAWHLDNEGWFEEDLRVTCHACTAMRHRGDDGKVDPVEYLSVIDTRDYTQQPLPPLSDLTAAARFGGDRP